MTIIFPSSVGKSGTTGIILAALGVATGTNPNWSTATPAGWVVAEEQAKARAGRVARIYAEEEGAA